jgi:hypothetical protein
MSPHWAYLTELFSWALIELSNLECGDLSWLCFETMPKS